MALIVCSMMQYLTVQVEQMRSDDHAALMVVKAVKGRPTGGMPRSMTFQGESFSFGPSNPERAIDLWAAWTVNLLERAISKGPIVLVPVPNTAAVHGEVDDFATADRARRVAARGGERYSVATELWFNKAMTPSSQGGPRFPSLIYPHLLFQASVVEGTRVLVDDVFTTGGHLRACAARLRDNNASAALAVCCGRTTHYQLENPFSVPVEKLPDFDPNDPTGLAADFPDVPF